jgi:transcriptional regulator with PAS, ATPase and Fis domain
MSIDRPTVEDQLPSLAVRRANVRVAEGPDLGTTIASRAERMRIGTHPSNDLVLRDPKVSRFHCEIEFSKDGTRVRDCESTNGTLVDGVRVDSAWLRDGSTLRLGDTVLRFEDLAGVNQLPLSQATRFGDLVGRSVAMRTTFARLERAAASDATVLLEGETGTGKGHAAQSVHALSERRDQPFVILDCSAVAANLIESEIFGHEKGAFTTALQRRIGAFEEANGGTIFLDEIGELPADLQPKLLRVLESRELRRVGGTGSISVDVRVIAGTNRSLSAEVNAGRFRADLYYRLAVLDVHMPSLRERPEDIPLIAENLLDSLNVPCDSELRAPEFLARLSRSAWPGNVRELRNALERALAFQLPLVPPSIDGNAPPSLVPGTLAEARDRAIWELEHRYLQNLLRDHDTMLAAAKAAGVSRVYLYKLLVRHNLQRQG